jgi:hypothetical protein
VPSCYWSSGGSEQPTEAITLVFRLCAPLTVVHEVLPGGWEGRVSERESEWTWWAHTGGGNALAFKQPT